MIGTDVHIQPKTFIPIIQYDGKKLPFPDESFDAVILVDVLHHDEHPEIILEEAKRVAKKFILVKDHYWENNLDFQLIKFADYFGNKPYGIKLPYN
ncbi:MAG: methyltransferase domain-containing protein [Candidatus Jacksonbacteria bacterium]